MHTMFNFTNKDGYVLRTAKREDAENYFVNNYCPLDSELVRLTGSKSEYSHEEVVDFFLKSLEDNDRIFLLLVSPEGNIVGESVVNELDRNEKSANFRIAIFHAEHRERGLGTWMTLITRDLAFECFDLEQLELDVFTFNPRARRVYEKVGFREMNVVGDTVTMSITRNEWESLFL